MYRIYIRKIIFSKDLNFNISKKIGIAFGLFLDRKDKRVIIGRDTRPSGEVIENGIIEGLISVGYEIVSVGICPSPVIVYAMNNLKMPAGIIITGSHNPAEYNGFKLANDFSETLVSEGIQELRKMIEDEDYEKGETAGKTAKQKW